MILDLVLLHWHVLGCQRWRILGRTIHPVLFDVNLILVVKLSDHLVLEHRQMGLLLLIQNWLLLSESDLGNLMQLLFLTSGCHIDRLLLKLRIHGAHLAVVVVVLGTRSLHIGKLLSKFMQPIGELLDLLS